MFTVLETPTFSKLAADYGSEDERGGFTAWIAANPDAGDVVPGSGGCAKSAGFRKAKESLERDAKRNIGAELLRSVREMKAGKRGRVHHIEVSPMAEARHKAGLSQAQFAVLLGVSKRTLQDWEQGRREPSGAAKSLLKIAEKRPDVLREVFG